MATVLAPRSEILGLVHHEEKLALRLLGQAAPELQTKPEYRDLVFDVMSIALAIDMTLHAEFAEPSFCQVAVRTCYDKMCKAAVDELVAKHGIVEGVNVGGLLGDAQVVIAIEIAE